MSFAHSRSESTKKRRRWRMNKNWRNTQSAGNDSNKLTIQLWAWTFHTKAKATEQNRTEPNRKPKKQTKNKITSCMHISNIHKTSNSTDHVGTKYTQCIRWGIGRVSNAVCIYMHIETGHTQCNIPHTFLNFFFTIFTFMYAQNAIAIYPIFGANEQHAYFPWVWALGRSIARASKHFQHSMHVYFVHLI